LMERHKKKLRELYTTRNKEILRALHDKKGKSFMSFAWKEKKTPWVLHIKKHQ
jgi:hypothetical protein